MLSIFKKFVANYALFRCTSFSLKIWLCEILDKYHVCVFPHHLDQRYCLLLFSPNNIAPVIHFDEKLYILISMIITTMIIMIIKIIFIILIILIRDLALCCSLPIILPPQNIWSELLIRNNTDTITVCHHPHLLQRICQHCLII